MFNPRNELGRRDDGGYLWRDYILFTVLGAGLATIGTKLAEWAMEEIREAVGRPPKHPEGRDGRS